MEDGRARRQAVVDGRGGKKFKNALAELAELRKSGGKGGTRLDIREEESVYDEVDEDEYARIVQRRREEGGGFVVGEDDLGYTDIGEEIDWINEDATKEGRATKSKDKKTEAGGKRKAADQAIPGARARMQKMFQTASVKSRPSKKAPVDDKSTEALLDDILGNLDTSSPAIAAPITTTTTNNNINTTTTAARVSTPGSNPSTSRRVFSRAAASSTPTTSLAPKSVSFAPLPPPAQKLAAKGVIRRQEHHRLASSATNASTPKAPSLSSSSSPPVTFGRMKKSAAVKMPRRINNNINDKDKDTDNKGDDSNPQEVIEYDEYDAPDYGPMDEDEVLENDALPLSDDVDDENKEEEEGKENAHPAPPAITPSKPTAATTTTSTPDTAGPVAGWQRIYRGDTAEQHQDQNKDDTKMVDGDVIDDDDIDAETAEPWVDDGTLPLDDDSRLPFYLLDAHEEYSQPGTVFLFGKVPAGPPGQFLSTCAIVKGLSRTLFFVPREAIGSPEIAELQAKIENGDADAKKQLIPIAHAAFGAVKTEARALLAKHGITQMTMKPVVRQYAFENKAVRHGKQWVLKVRYPASQPLLPLGIDGDTFSAVLGANQGSLEALMLKRRIMGPAWISLSKPRRISSSGAQVSYCQVEVEVEGHKSVFATSDGSRRAPPLTVAAVHIKTVINPVTAANEVVAASVVYLPKVDTDGPTQISQKNIRHFSGVRKLEGMGFPTGFDAEVKKINASDVGRRNGGAVLAAQPNERALLTMLIMRLRDADADVFVGHNFSAFDLDVLLHRMQALKVPHWSSLGRLKRSKFPSLSGGGHSFGGGASAGALSVIAGRLLCDTYLAARDLVKETEYTLSTLSKNLLGETRSELAIADIPGKFASPAKLLELVHHTESDAWLSLRLAFYLVVLPLTRQLAELSGSLWSKALLNQRAQRIEYLLLHEFHNNKFLLPDKVSIKERERMEKSAAAIAAAMGDDDGMDHDDDDDDNDHHHPAKSTTTKKKKGAASTGGKRAKKKGPQYAGGLVLEPKKGLYERYVLLLDFNSLYPSIIQEYNICFTTVERPENDDDGTIPPLPTAVATSPETRAPLPRVIGALVQRRRRVKEMIKGERDPVKKEQLNIRQQALKLLANSMYGCLGFSNSRFYAKPIAELITSQGREILQSTVDVVQGTIGREVIYGDTDSIMVNTDTTTLADVVALGQAIKKEVNKRYRLLEIEMDGIFKCMLLLKKKKYAAIKVERAPDGSQIEIVEAKGLDMVRRDWCALAKQASQFALDRILSCQPREEVVAAIHEHLAALAQGVNVGNAVPLNKFIITKQLTKRPEDYPDGKNQPHVQVALRRKSAGKRDGTMPGETVPYVICTEMDDEGNVLPRDKKGLADRAYGPDEVLSSGGRLVIDADYYIAQQVFPVVSRLVAPIEGTDAAHIAESLGLDGARYRALGRDSVMSREDALAAATAAAAAAGLDDDDRFKRCAPLVLKGRSGKEFAFKGVRELLRGDAAAVGAALLAPEDADVPDVAPLTPAQVVNQVTMHARSVVAKYYEGRLRSDDDIMPCSTRNVCLRELPDGKPGTAPPDVRCSGIMHQEMTEAELYTQLSYYHRLMDVESALHALGDSRDARMAAEQKLAPIRMALDLGAAAAAQLRDKSGYRWVDLGAVFARASS